MPELFADLPAIAILLPAASVYVLWALFHWVFKTPEDNVQLRESAEQGKAANQGYTQIEPSNLSAAKQARIQKNSSPRSNEQSPPEIAVAVIDSSTPTTASKEKGTAETETAFCVETVQADSSAVQQRLMGGAASSQAKSDRTAPDNQTTITSKQNSENRGASFDTDLTGTSAANLKNNYQSNCLVGTSSCTPTDLAPQGKTQVFESVVTNLKNKAEHSSAKAIPFRSNKQSEKGCDEINTRLQTALSPQKNQDLTETIPPAVSAELKPENAQTGSTSSAQIPEPKTTERYKTAAKRKPLSPVEEVQLQLKTPELTIRSAKSTDECVESLKSAHALEISKRNDEIARLKQQLSALTDMQLTQKALHVHNADASYKQRFEDTQAELKSSARKVKQLQAAVSKLQTENHEASEATGVYSRHHSKRPALLSKVRVVSNEL